MNQTEVNYGEVLSALKLGKKAQRVGWNGKNMWIALMPGVKSLPAKDFWNPHAAKFAEENGGQAEILPYFIFKTADNKILMGWLASQTDMVAEDWVIMDE